MAPQPQPQRKPAPAPVKPPLSLLGELQRIEKQWAQVPVVEYGARLPEGVYVMKLGEVTVGVSTKEPNKGTTYVRLQFEVVEGDLAGRTHSDIYMLKDDESIGRLKGRVKNLGKPYATLAEMDAGLKELIDEQSLFQVTISGRTGKDGKTYQDFNIDRPVETPADRQAAEQLGAELDQDGAAEAETPPAVQQTAARAPAATKGPRRAPPQAAADAGAGDLLADLQ